MIKYKYEYDAVSKLTTRVFDVEYPDTDTVNDLLASTQPDAVIKTALQLVYDGLAEEQLLAIEESWWVVQDELQQDPLKVATTKITELTATDKLTLDGKTVPLTKEELDINKQLLDELLGIAQVTDTKGYLVKVEQSVTDLVTSRTNIEDGDGMGNVNPNQWLIPYRGAKTTTTRPVTTGVIPKSVLKRLVAKSRNMHVRNTEDTLADLAKMNSLLFSMVAVMYNTLSTTAKAKIPAAERQVTEYAIAQFSNIQTRADRQLVTEGVALIDKLFIREVEIADIVDRLLK